MKKIGCDLEGVQSFCVSCRYRNNAWACAEFVNTNQPVILEEVEGYEE